VSVARCLVFGAALCAGSPSHAQERLPAGVVAIRHRAADIENRPHPLFDEVKVALTKLQSGDAKPLERMLLPTSKVQLRGSASGDADVKFLRAAMDSCSGPYLFDESESWIQFSWVCQSNQSTSLDRYIALKEFGELSATIWFEGAKIKEAIFQEPIWVPGMSFYALPSKKALQ